MGFLDSEGLTYFWEKVKPGLGGTGGGGVPKGSIIIWSGSASDIPDGWALCDGQDGRPDLRDRFVLGGGGTHPVGETGGEEKHTLVVEEMPEHRHGILILSSESGYYSTAGPVEGSLQGRTQDTENAGGSAPHNNMPPYYVLCYIIKVTDGGSGGGSGSAEEVYSTEETRIGTWIDGKPLYRKVFQVTCPPAGPYQVVIPASDLPNMRIKRIDGYLYSNSNPAGGPINFAYSRAYIATWNYAGAIYMETNNADYANSPAEIIFEYTKTTD